MSFNFFSEKQVGMAHAKASCCMKTLNLPELKKFEFEIKARKHRNGFMMSSPFLPCPLQYSNLNKAIRFAKSIARGRGCEIRLHNSDGTAINTFEFGLSLG